jgi:hypothetical protein
MADNARVEAGGAFARRVGPPDELQPLLRQGF